MKQIMLIISCAAFSLFGYSQINPGGGINLNNYYTPKAYDIFPVADSEINLNTDDEENGGDRSGSSPDCSISIYNYDTSETSYIEGDISNNMYYLSGNIVGMLGVTYSDAILPQQPYVVFTANSTTNVDMFVLSNSDEIIAYCNDYSGTSGHNWGTESRINMTGNESPKAVILICQNTSRNTF